MMIYERGMEGYDTFRIPVITKCKNGDLLAFAEARKNSALDYGHIDIVSRRSRDNGLTWDKMEILFSDGANTFGNQCPIVDRETGDICMVFCTNQAEGMEELILKGEEKRRVWKSVSHDNGKTWIKPEEITGTVSKPGWTWYATGPCHAVQLKSGRYLVPCNHGELGHEKIGVTKSHFIYSDDKGVTWRLGAEADWETNECTVCETQNGTVYLNMRSRVFGLNRASVFSYDGGESITALKEEPLVDPFCQGSVLSSGNMAWFINCNAVNRTNLTLYESKDGCKNWRMLKVIQPGHSAYSDMAVTEDNFLAIVYETGTESPYEKIEFVRCAI